MASNQQPALDTTDAATDRGIPAGLAEVVDSLRRLGESIALGICPACGQRSVASHVSSPGCTPATKVSCSACGWVINNQKPLFLGLMKPDDRLNQDHMSLCWLLRCLAAEAEAFRQFVFQRDADQAEVEPGVFAVNIYDFVARRPTWSDIHKFLPEQEQMLRKLVVPSGTKCLSIEPGCFGHEAPDEETDYDDRQCAKPKSATAKKRVPR